MFYLLLTRANPPKGGGAKPLSLKQKCYDGQAAMLIT